MALEIWKDFVYLFCEVFQFDLQESEYSFDNNQMTIIPTNSNNMTLLDNDAFSTQDIEPIEIAKFCDVCDKLDTIYSLFDELFRRENHELVFLEIQHIYKIISSAKQIPLTPLFLSCNIPSHLITLLEVTDPQFFLWTATLIMSYSRFPDHFVLFLRNGLIEKIIPISLHITDEDFRYGPIVDMIEFISGFSSYECEHLFSICLHWLVLLLCYELFIITL